MGKLIFFIIIICIITQLPQVKDNIGSKGDKPKTEQTSQAAPQNHQPAQDPAANAKAASLLQEGKNVYYGLNGSPKDPYSAPGYFRQAADMGNTEAQVLLGQMYLTGTYIDKNQDEALKLFKTAADLGNADAQVKLAEFHIKQKQYELAADILKRNTNDNPKTQTKLGELYLTGKGVEKNYKEAFNLFKQAAEKGNALAQYRLGDMYFKAQGIKRNYAEALKWYTKSASKGNKDAAYALGMMYAEGIGVKQDNDTAMRWFTKSGRSGAFLL